MTRHLKNLDNSVMQPDNVPSYCAVQGIFLRRLSCWDCGFETQWGHGCLSVVCVFHCFWDELITSPAQSCRLWCVPECIYTNLVNKEALAHWGLLRQKLKINIYIQMGFTRLSGMTDCNKETMSRDSILHGTLQLIWLRFSSVNAHKRKVKPECKWNTTKHAINHNQQIRRRANTYYTQHI